MNLIKAGEALAEMCYNEVYPADYNEEAIAYDFQVEIDLIENDPHLSESEKGDFIRGILSDLREYEEEERRRDAWDRSHY